MNDTKEFWPPQIKQSCMHILMDVGCFQVPLEQYVVFTAFPDKGKVFLEVEITALGNSESRQWLWKAHLTI